MSFKQVYPAGLAAIAMACASVSLADGSKQAYYGENEQGYWWYEGNEASGNKTQGATSSRGQVVMPEQAMRRSGSGKDKSLITGFSAKNLDSLKQGDVDIKIDGFAGKIKKDVTGAQELAETGGR